MPTAFFAMSWAPEDPRAADHAARIRMRMMDGPVPPVCIEAQGFLLADLSQPAAPRTPMIELHRTDGRLGGVIFGTLFPRQGQKRLTDIRHAAATSLLDTNGRGLYRDYWGSYVAFFRAGDDLAVHADPVSSIPVSIRPRTVSRSFFESGTLPVPGPEAPQSQSSLHLDTDGIRQDPEWRDRAQ